jgi:outer membrane protein assembly factor BamB
MYDVNAADPILSDDKVFISSGYERGASLIKVNSNGKTEKLWENKNMRNHMNSSVLLNGALFGIDGNSGPKATLKCIDFETGAIKWNKEGVGSGALMAADNKLIVLSEKGELFIAEANPKEYKELARAQVIGGKNWTVPVLANGRIYCRNAKGDLVCVDVKQ